jgi:acetylornithine deacetylase/succinyl-diaminopimelate desuccinylase-like protein
MTKPHLKRNHSFILDTLTFAMSRKRPHAGHGVEQLAQYIERQVPGKITRDKVGNLHLDLRQVATHRTLFVAHLDTVHRHDGKNLTDWKQQGWVKAAGGGPLGADDAAGVAILCYLAKNLVPAYYVFTQGEECGGIGAQWLAEHNRGLLRQFDRAIAFDRKDTFSVISHQGWSGRCCSDEFADALSGALNDAGMLYMPDDTGVYTDTAEFTSFVPECTNISVGYYKEHTPKECLDLTHFLALAKAAMKLDWDGLPTKRDPVVKADMLMVDPYQRDRKMVVDGEFLEVEYSDYDLDLCDALEAAQNGNNGMLAMMLAERLMSDPDDVDIAERSLGRARIDPALIEDAFDDIDNYGGECAADILAEAIVGLVH